MNTLKQRTIYHMMMMMMMMIVFGQLVVLKCPVIAIPSLSPHRHSAR